MNGESAPLALACRARARVRGLLFTAPQACTLLLSPCHDVHTVGMMHRLDIAFINADGRVIEAHRAVGPLRRLRNPGAQAVVERFSTVETPWFEVGDRVALTRLSERNLR